MAYPKIVRVLIPGPPWPYNSPISQELTDLPYDINGAFGGTWKTGNRHSSTGDDQPFNGSRATSAIMRFAGGSGTNGPGTSDYALHVEAQKADFLNSAIQGEVDGMNVVVRQGELGDSAAIVVNTRKVQSALYGQTGVECKLDWVEATTGNVIREFKAVLGGNLGGSDLRAGGFGLLARCDVGQIANGVAIFNNGGLGFERVFQAATGLDEINRFFEITGQAHADGRGLVRAFEGTPGKPSYSFVNLPDAGFWHSLGNTFSAGISGKVVTRWVADHFIVGPELDDWLPASSTGQTGISLGYGGTIVASATGAPGLWQRLESDGQILQFYRDTALVGNISVTATSTAYNTSSDSRLKTEIEDLSGIGGLIDALQPVRFRWKANAEKDMGFIAQQVAAILPKIASQDSDGYWQMDFSKLVPLLVSEVKALRKRIAAIEDKA